MNMSKMEEEDLCSDLCRDLTLSVVTKAEHSDTSKENYYLDLRQKLDDNIDKVCCMSPSTPTSLTSQACDLTPQLPVAPPDPRLLDSALQSSVSSDASENTVIASKNENTESWSNTFESNFTDTSVDEPKYAKVSHRKRNSKIASGNSTPKTKRRKPSETRLSRENSSKLERISVHIKPTSVTSLHQPIDSERSNYILASEVVEEIEVDRTVTSADIVQDHIKDANDSLQCVLTSIYAKILIILGLVLPLATVSNEGDQRYLELFYIYLFMGSILFLIFVYIDLIHTKTKYAVLSHRKKKSLLTVKESLRDSGRSSKSSNSTVRVKKDNHPLPSLQPNILREESFNSLLPRPSAHYGSFYLRLGTVLFGIGSLIYIGIEMGGLFQVGFLNNHLSTCGDMFNILRPSLQIAFIFFQMYFIFLNQKMNLYKRKFVTRLGLMHMIATNFCVLIKVLVVEANHEIIISQERNVRDVDNSSFLDSNTSDFRGEILSNSMILDLDSEVTPESEDNSLQYLCDPTMISQLKLDSSPYLYPCLVQFSLICAAVLFIMWKNVATEHQYYKLTKLKLMHDEDRGDYSSSCQRYSVDCNGSNTGLFCGVMVVVLTIVSLILFFVFITNTDPYLQHLAVQVASYSEIALYGLTSIAVMLGMCQMRRLWYDVSRSLELDTALLATAQAGVLLYASFSAVGFFLQPQACLVPLLASISRLVQTVLQTAFIIDASYRFASTSSHIRHKPGRQVVTFLLVCNLTMWLVNILEMHKVNTSKREFDLSWQVHAWPVVSTISIPLASFYRFHSAVCLFEVWKKSFKYKPTNIDYM